MICERFVEIFLKTVMFDINLMLNIYLVRSYGYMKTRKSIGMLAYKANFCDAVNLKFVQMLS